MSLVRRLPKIAARVLHNTRCVPQNMKNKFELISIAYGAAAVERDFEEWCREHVEDRFPFPITEYLKVIDTRLGSAKEEPRADMKDPRIADLRSMSYELTGVLPPKRAVAELLLSFTPEEIKAALKEYTDNLTEKETKAGMHAFYADGGAAAIILARQRRG